MKLADRLTELRRRKGFSQEYVARRMRVSRQTVSKWELGTTAPGTENLIKLSEVLGVPLEYLVKDDVPLPEPQEEEKQDPPPTKSRRGVIAILLIIAAILTMAMAIGHLSQKGGDTEEIPFEELQEEKIVSTPNSNFGFAWED